jgi:hypothetical protein
MTTRSGQCLCGGVRFTIAAEPSAVRICWCRDCQHIAANGTVNMLVDSAALSVTGTLAEHKKLAASGAEVTRQFCPGCGSHLFARSSTRPQFVVVRVGNLDDPSSVRPTMNIWAASAPEWACLDASLARAEGQPLPPGVQSSLQ